MRFKGIRWLCSEYVLSTCALHRQTAPPTPDHGVDSPVEGDGDKQYTHRLGASVNARELTRQEEGGRFRRGGDVSPRECLAWGLKAEP